MKKILLFDTSICTENLGDYLIMESLKLELRNIFQNDFFIHVPTHDKLWKNSFEQIKKSDFLFVCGTNLLSSNMNSYNQWKINLFDSLFLKNIILMGVGWWQYQKKPNIYTKKLLNKILHRGYLHSVRDNYTLNKLKSIGIKNVINTGCPTLWHLTKKHCESIPTKKAENVLFTFTNYNQNYNLDLKLFEILKRNYRKLYFWPQSFDDLKYANEISKKNIILINPNLKALDEILDSNIDLDYVGTRLHSGIRAMQFKRRTIIIGIDNRAIELSKDSYITLIKRDEIDFLTEKINSNFETKISLPCKHIEKWKKQFIV